MNIENKIITTIENAKQNVVKITTSKKKGFLKTTTTNKLCGSGFFLKNNYIITNAHVVENTDNLKIELINGKKYSPTIIGKNIDYDICILKIKPLKSVKLLKFNSKDLKTGNIVISIGMPFGLDFSSTMGIISSLDHSLKNEYGKIIPNVIQIDNTINPGNSGGPLLNLKGEIIGMNTISIYDSNNISFALKMDLVESVANNILKKAEAF